MGKNQFIQQMKKLFGEGVDPYAIKTQLEAEMNGGKLLGLNEVVTYYTHSEETRSALVAAQEELKSLIEVSPPANSDTILVDGIMQRGGRLGNRNQAAGSVHLLENIVIHNEREG